MTGAAAPGTIGALTFVIAYEIKQDPLAALMRDRPALVEELRPVLSRRLEAERPQSAETFPHGAEAMTFGDRIPQIFQLS